MLNLSYYRSYWESVAEHIDGVTGVLPVTIDKEMGKRIQSVPADSLTIFVLPPFAEPDRRAAADAFAEVNKCVVFIMKKYNPQRKDPFSLLEETQPVIEAVKKDLLKVSGMPCSRLKVDVASIETAPETELYGVFAGWSITFNANSYGL